MKPRTLLPLFASIVAIMPLAACVSPPTRMAANDEATPLQPCQQVTGSRIRPKQGKQCQPVGYPFKSFSAEELRATGEIDLGEALRQLDPAFR